MITKLIGKGKYRDDKITKQIFEEKIIGVINNALDTKYSRSKHSIQVKFCFLLFL